MKQPPKQVRKQPPEGFWNTQKGRAILANREREQERDAWRRFDAWA